MENLIFGLVLAAVFALGYVAVNRMGRYMDNIYKKNNRRDYEEYTDREKSDKDDSL